MMWMSQEFFNSVKKLLGGGDNMTPDNLLQHIEALQERADKVTPATMSLSRSRNALVNEAAQLEADVAGLKSLISLKEGLLISLGGLPASKKRNVPASDSDVTKQMMAVAGGCEIRS